jgi:hypothetical protein
MNLLGSNSGNIFDARSGDDNLYGGDSRDIFNGNKGNDFISGGKVMTSYLEMKIMTLFLATWAGFNLWRQRQ